MRSLETMRERAIIVGLEIPGEPVTEDDLDEMSRLAESAGACVIQRVIQRRHNRDPRCFIGRGKASELRDLVLEGGADCVLVASNLTPGQASNLEAILNCKVVDRTQLIMDIFAQRARTREGHLQVELAQLTYLLPRLTGRGGELSRLGGGIGTRGPGETKLEVDRRTIRRRIADLRSQIDEVGRRRALHRKARQDVPLPVCALVGYTNAGKSTLLRTLTGADVKVEDRLFATLDPTTRKITLGNGQEVLLTDTVGFIRRLPPHLVAAFRATLEEVVEADVLLHVVDSGHQHLHEQMAAVNSVLETLGVRLKSTITVFNKMDTVSGGRLRGSFFRDYPNPVTISALRGQGLDSLLLAIEGVLAPWRRTVSITLPSTDGRLLSAMHRHGRVLQERFEDGMVHLVVELDSVWAGRILAGLEGRRDVRYTEGVLGSQLPDK